MTKITSAVIVLALLLVACGPKPSEFWDSQLHPLTIEFMNQNQLATSTPRGDLGPVISQMVAARTKIEVLAGSDDVPKCAMAGMTALVSSSQAVVNAAQDWVSIEYGWTDSQYTEHDDRVGRTWSQAEGYFRDAVQQVQADCKLQ